MYGSTFFVTRKVTKARTNIYFIVTKMKYHDIDHGKWRVAQCLLSISRLGIFDV